MRITTLLAVFAAGVPLTPALSPQAGRGSLLACAHVISPLPAQAGRGSLLARSHVISLLSPQAGRGSLPASPHVISPLAPRSGERDRVRGEQQPPPQPKPSTPATAPAAPGTSTPSTPATPPTAGAGASTAAPQTLGAAIDRLGTLDYGVRTQASRIVRRAAAAQAVPALVQAVSKHKDGYVRFRALVLLAGFGDPQVRTVMLPAIDDPNDRLREVAYSYFERNPDPTIAPKLIAKLDTEQSEFVRPALIHALAALGTDPKVQQVLLHEVTRGQDFFRSEVIDALGDHKATYAVAALTAIARQDGPLQDDAVIALGQIGDKRMVDTFAPLQRSAPRERQPALAAAICLLGVNCDSHERFLYSTIKFAIANPGFQDLTRAAARGLSHLAAANHPNDWDALIQLGGGSVDPVRAPLALGFASAAVEAPEQALAAVQRASDQKAALMLLRDGFDMLEEDYAEEQFYVAVRKAYWKLPEGDPARKAAEALITTLEF
jgi:HEAT repeat protein